MLDSKDWHLKTGLPIYSGPTRMDSEAFQNRIWLWLWIVPLPLPTPLFVFGFSLVLLFSAESGKKNCFLNTPKFQGIVQKQSGHIVLESNLGAFGSLYLNFLVFFPLSNLSLPSYRVTMTFRLSKVKNFPLPGFMILDGTLEKVSHRSLLRT